MTVSRQRVEAIVERELRKFVRNPVVLIMTLFMPLLQLVVLGHAFGGRVTHLNVGLVDEDGGPSARRIHAALLALQSNGDMVRPTMYRDERTAAADVRSGKISGAIVLPPHFTADTYAGHQPRLGLLLDNTDNFASATVRALAEGVVQQAARPKPGYRESAAVTLEPVELYPFVPYERYMLPGVISLGLFMSVMIGGAILYLDDKQRGVHEGYLVTPITKFELVLAQNLAGTIKAAVAGILLTIVGALIAGAGGVLEPVRLFALCLVVVFTSFGFMAMTSCMVARAEDPIAPRAAFGMLLPERRRVPGAITADMAARAHHHRSVLLCRACTACAVVERRHHHRHSAGPVVSRLVCRAHVHRHHGAVPQNVVIALAIDAPVQQ